MIPALAVLFLTAAEPPQDKEKELSEAAQKELKKFEGKWRADKVVVDGQETTIPAAAELAMEFVGRKFTIGKDKRDVAEITALDPSADPKSLDFKALLPTGELREGVIYEAIYKLDGDTLILAVHVGEGKKRPTKFEAPKDGKVVLMTFQREKR